MVLKKSKHEEYNTGNTQRSAALRQTSHKARATLLTKYFEYAESEIQRAIDDVLNVSARTEHEQLEIAHEMSVLVDYEYELDEWLDKLISIIPNTDRVHLGYLLTLRWILETISYLPRYEVEFSLDKKQRWKLVEMLDERNLPNLWRHLPKKDGPGVQPFEVTYQKTVNWTSSERSCCYYGEDHQTNIGPHGNTLPYDSSWKRQAIYHNTHRRGIQRKAHLKREKKVFTRRKPFWTYYRRQGWIKEYAMPSAYLAEECYRQSQQTSYTDSDPPSVFLQYKLNNYISSKELSNYKPVVENRNERKPVHKEIMQTSYGSQYGVPSGLRGVHLVSQERFSALKTLEERRKHPPINKSWIHLNHGMQTDQRQGRNHQLLVKMQTKNMKCRKEEQNKSNHKRQKDVDISWPSLTERNKATVNTTDVDKTDVDKNEDGIFKWEIPKRQSKQARRLEKKLAKKEMRKMYRDIQQKGRSWKQRHHDNQVTGELGAVTQYLGNIPESAEYKILKDGREKIPGIRPIASQQHSQEQSQGFFTTEPPLNVVSKNIVNEVKKRSDVKVKPTVKVMKKLSSEVKDSSDVSAVGDQRPHVEVAVWEVIRSIVDRDDHRGLDEINIAECSDKSCSVIRAKTPANQLVPSKPQGNRTSRLRTRIKEKPKLETLENEIDDKVMGSKNVASKRRRKKAKSKQSLCDLILKYPNQTANGFLPIGFLVKVKTSTLQANYLQQKYGAQYLEGTAKPRRFWVNVSVSVADMRNHGKISMGAMNINEDLPFMNIHAVLMIEQFEVRFPGAQEQSKAKQKAVPNETVIVQLKCDLDLAGKMEVYRRVRAKVRPHMLYPLPKLVEYLIEVYKVITLEGYQAVEHQLSVTSESPTLRIRQYEWLYSLTTWEYQVHSALDTYNMFKNQMPRDQLFAETGSPNLAQNTSESTQNAPVHNLTTLVNSAPDACSYVLCERCHKTIIVSGDFNIMANSPELLARLARVTQNGWTLKYSRALACGHTVCDRCLHLHVLSVIADGNSAFVKCPVIGCNVNLDPVVTLSAVSVTKYCKLLRQRMDNVVSSHPQWAWCPAISCDRAMKITGSALLEGPLVIECFCKHTWCFQCKKAAHWPAGCDQSAIYWEWREIEAGCHGYKMRKLLCSTCVGSNSTRPPPAENSGRSLMIYTAGQKNNPCDKQSGCGCVPVFCSRCLNVPDFPIHVPKSILDNKTVSLSSSQDALLPVLLFRQAVSHYRTKDQWRPEVTEPKAVLLSRLVAKSRLRASTKAPSLGPSRAATTLHVAPTVGTDQLFLVLVYQFVYQAHMFLEYVYVDLMTSETVSMATRVEILKHVVKLEKNISEIDQVVNGHRYSPASILSRLKHLSDVGKTIMSTIATRMRHMGAAHSPRPTPRLQGQGRRTLPPLGYVRNETQ